MVGPMSDDEHDDDLGYHNFGPHPPSSDDDNDRRKISPLSKRAAKIALVNCKIQSCCTKKWCCGREQYDKYDIQVLRDHYEKLTAIDSQFIKQRLDESGKPKRFYLDQICDGELANEVDAKNRVCSRYFKQALGCSNDKVPQCSICNPKCIETHTNNIYFCRFISIGSTEAPRLWVSSSSLSAATSTLELPRKPIRSSVGSSRWELST